MNASRQREWAEAKRRCRLSDETVAMAKELGLSPRSLTKNIPSPSEPWKAPVEAWVRRLHSKRFGRRRPSSSPPAPAPEGHREDSPSELAPGASAAPNELEIAREALLERAKQSAADAEALFEEMEELERHAPMSGGEIDEENRHLLRRRDSFRRFADLFAALPPSWISCSASCCSAPSPRR